MREQQRTGTKYQQRVTVNNNRYRNELNDNERVPTTTKSETKPSDQNYMPQPGTVATTTATITTENSRISTK
jgi:hypothetical protein